MTLFVALSVGCADEGARLPSDGSRGTVRLAGIGPLVEALDSLLLEETEFHLGQPYSLSVDTADGSFLIADDYSGRIFRFARDGRIVQWYGRPGEGPGEFRGLSRAFILNDSTVAGNDVRRNLLTRFSRDTGEPLGSTRCDGCWGGVPAVVGDMAFVPALDPVGYTMLAAWDWQRDTVRGILSLPLPYRRSLEGTQVFRGIFGGTMATAWTDTLLVGLVGMNELFLATWDGLPLDTLHVPRVRRRGVPSDAQERIDLRDERTSFRDRIEMLSSLQGVYRMPDRSTFLIHQDNSFTGEPPVIEFTADVYVSVLSPDLSSVCADGPLPFANQLRVVHTAARDTVFLLDRTLNAVGDTMRSWIRTYRIDTTPCEWLPVR